MKQGRLYPQYLETLESSASSRAASPCTASPRFSFSISKPPSYLPMSSSASVRGFCAAGLTEAGCFVVFPGLGFAEGFSLESGKGLGAANFVRSLETLVWLVVFWSGRVGFVAPFCLAEISRAAICRVTEPTEAIAIERTMKRNTRNSKTRRFNLSRDRFTHLSPANDDL